jgi:hypothetical protein
MSRVWVYSRLRNSTPLNIPTLVNGRVFASTSLNQAPQAWPFIMYRQTSDVDWMRGDDKDQCRAAGYMVFAHDKPGDYLKIDTMIALIQGLFKDVEDQPNGIIRSRWIETSEDFRDEDMGTVFKYGRIQTIYRV